MPRTKITPATINPARDFFPTLEDDAGRAVDVADAEEELALYALVDVITRVTMEPFASVEVTGTVTADAGVVCDAGWVTEGVDAGGVEEEEAGGGVVEVGDALLVGVDEEVGGGVVVVVVGSGVVVLGGGVVVVLIEAEVSVDVVDVPDSLACG